MAGACMPIPVAHGEGRVRFANEQDADQALCSLAYVDASGKPTAMFPLNPNGSDAGQTAFTTTDGRVTIMMPHPERAFLNKQMSWRPPEWSAQTPWLRMFQNARAWIDKN